MNQHPRGHGTLQVFLDKRRDLFGVDFIVGGYVFLDGLQRRTAAFLQTFYRVIYHFRRRRMGRFRSGVFQLLFLLRGRLSLWRRRGGGSAPAASTGTGDRRCGILIFRVTHCLCYCCWSTMIDNFLKTRTRTHTRPRSKSKINFARNRRQREGLGYSGRTED